MRAAPCSDGARASLGERWSTDPDSARRALSAAISPLLRLLRRDADAARSREPVLLSVLAERPLLKGAMRSFSSQLATSALDLITLALAHELRSGKLPLKLLAPLTEQACIGSQRLGDFRQPSFCRAP